MSSNGSADKSPLISRSEARDKIRNAIRMFVGRGKRYSVKQASNGSGVPDRLIECAMCDPGSTDWRDLSLDALLSLSSFLGPDFTCEWLSLAQQGAFWIPNPEDLPAGEIAADSAEDCAAVARAAADGRFDRDERPVLRAVGTRMMARGAQLRAVGSVAA
ncbi:MAG TPA: hypothetical protein VE053_06810 [Allosphingosinicella sp.]|nr:hypothetical protein [Allosphingosinicella sp.]